MAVSSERELESTPEAASVANTQDEELEHGTDIQLGHPSLTASGQISQQLLEEAFQKEESRKERQEAREEAREERQEARDEARKERQEARDEARKQELHLLNVEEHKARINQLAIAKSSQIPAAQDIPGGRRLAKRKRSESPSNEKGKLKLFEKSAEERKLKGERALELRNLIKQEIEILNQPSDADVKSSGIAAQLSNAGVPFPYAVAQLSNPDFQTRLLFPLVGSNVPKRFNGDPEGDKDRWLYVGREEFVNLVNKFRCVQEYRSTDTLLVYGTKGYGKSHLLAALVCYLAAQGEQVVYIPDCRAFIMDSVEIFRLAMLFAWADNPALKDQIIKLNSLEEISLFLNGYGKKTIFVFDQMNSLEESDQDEKETRRKKADISWWLESCRGGCNAIFGSSANHRTFRLQLQKENNTEPLKLQGGFTETEMEQWWRRHENIMEGNCNTVRGGYTKDQIEDITGKIPLFLDQCVVKDEKGQPFMSLDTNILSMTYGQAWRYERQIREENIKHLDLHDEYIIACLSDGITPSMCAALFPELVDHRFFFDEFNEKKRVHVANYTCGLARNAVATQLHVEKVNLSNSNFWGSLLNHINNPCITGFIIEQAILSRISFDGLNVAGKDINTPMSMVSFSGSFPYFRTDITEQPILYCPRKFNYRGIDAVIVRIEPSPITNFKQRLFIYPLQITLTDTHSDSHKTFFDDYKSWTHRLERFDVVPTFLWISPKVASPKRHNPTNTDDWPAHSEEYVPISQVHSELWQYYEKVKRDQRTQRAPEKSSCGDRRMEKQGVSEELEGPGEQVRSDRSGITTENKDSLRRKVYQSMTVVELKLELKSRELSRTGNKQDLVNRLVKDDRTNAI